MHIINVLELIKRTFQQIWTYKKMHDLYKEECEKQNINAKKSAYYRYIFNNNFNINFHLSQKRTDLIAVKKLKKNNNNKKYQ